MVEKFPSVNLSPCPLLCSISEACDLVSPKLGRHHKMVAFIAGALGRMLGLKEMGLQELVMAALVHDIGGLSLRRRLEVFNFEFTRPAPHTLPGYVLLKGFGPFAEIARLVRYHHVYWQYGSGREQSHEQVPWRSHIIHLADRVAIQIDPDVEILSQKRGIVDRIKENSGRMFVPEQVEAFVELAESDVFWFEVDSHELEQILYENFPLPALEIERHQLLDLAEMFRRLIDFRSRFTATHSSGVAAVAAVLAEKAETGGLDGRKLHMAGLLHDIGKLVVPAEILDKQQPLVRDDFAVIRKHPYYSHRILRCIEGFGDISQWTALHHERLDGSGYPYRKKAAELPVGARILAAADTFTALTEDRPYRCGISGPATETILADMVVYHKLDEDFVGLIRDNLEEISHICKKTQAEADYLHGLFLEECRLLGTEADMDEGCPGL